MDLLITYIILATLVTINAIALFVVGYDKRTSITRDHDSRLPEGMLFFLATVFGAVGVFAGMQLFRHKTRKWYFQIGIPLLIIQNLTTLYTILSLENTIVP